jgi:polyhydroxyalkanoate synthase
MSGPLLRTTVRNAWALSPFGQGIESDHKTPSTLLYEAPHARVERVAPSDRQAGNPVLLVTPLAVPVFCWDLRRGQSLAAHLAQAEGRPTYTIDYGAITFADRAMGFEHWVDGILPEAVRRIAAEHGQPVHLVGWSHGGTMSLLLGAHLPDLPIASITALGTPTDYRLNPLYAPLFAAHEAGGLGLVLAGTMLMGGTPAALTRLGFRWMTPLRELGKPWSLARNLHRHETLARIAAVDRFIDSMPGYPARYFHQAIARLVCDRELARGAVRLTDDLTVDMHRLVTPTLLIASTADVLANAASVEAGVRAYPNARVDSVTVGGLSHLGLISSPRARDLTWPAIVRHLRAHEDGTRVDDFVERTVTPSPEEIST